MPVSMSSNVTTLTKYTNNYKQLTTLGQGGTFYVIDHFGLKLFDTLNAAHPHAVHVCHTNDEFVESSSRNTVGGVVSTVGVCVLPCTHGDVHTQSFAFHRDSPCWYSALSTFGPGEPWDGWHVQTQIVGRVKGDKK